MSVCSPPCINKPAFPRAGAVSHRPAPPPVLGPGGGGGQGGRGQTEGCGYRDLPPPGDRGPREEDRLPSVQQIPDGRAPSPDVLPGGRDLFPGGE